MEANQPTFDLNNAIKNWQANMQDGALTPDDAIELTGHLSESVIELTNLGLSDEEAWLVALHRIGNPAEIDKEFSKVNPDFFASRNLLMLFWGGSIFMLLQSLFFVFPNITWYIVINVLRGNPQHLLSVEQTRILLYVFCVIAFGLITLVMLKPGKISSWFSNLITKHSTAVSLALAAAGSLIGTFNYKTITYNMIERGQNSLIINNALDLLAILFYGAVIFCTAWLTMRYRKQEFRSVKVFGDQINWLMSFAIGTLAELIVCASNIFHSHTINYMLIALTFGPAGWLIGQSKKYPLNILMMQAFAFYALWGVAYYSADQALLDCLTKYVFTLVVLIVGVIIRRNKYIIINIHHLHKQI